jgi:thiamine-phosphate pyrophosphorylase
MALGGRDILTVISRSLEAGVDIIQFRDKEAGDREFLETGRKIKRLLDKKGVLFIVDDRVDMALELDSDGVHLGEKDMAAEKARGILGRKKIIGLTAHSKAEMHKAIKEGADYISIGPVFSTPMKPSYKAIGLEPIRLASRELEVPFVAIGGINESNIRSVVDSGAKRIAVVRAVLSAEDPFVATGNLIKKIHDTARTCKTK